MDHLFIIRRKTDGFVHSGAGYFTSKAVKARFYNTYKSARNQLTRAVSRAKRWNSDEEVGRTENYEVVAYSLLEDKSYVNPVAEEIKKLIGTSDPTPRELASAIFRFTKRAAFPDRVDALEKLISKAGLKSLNDAYRGAYTTGEVKCQDEARPVVQFGDGVAVEVAPTPPDKKVVNFGGVLIEVDNKDTGEATHGYLPQRSGI